MNVSFKINIKYFLLTILSFTIAYTTASGSIQNYIHFAGELNEMAFCFFALFLGVITTALTFEKNSNK
jgi:hypothetical protein